MKDFHKKFFKSPFWKGSIHDIWKMKTHKYYKRGF